MRSQKTKISEYNVIFQGGKGGWFSVWVPELPGCASQGETFDEALVNIKEASSTLSRRNKKGKSPVLSYKKQFVVPVQISASNYQRFWKRVNQSFG